jgi:hypothetical protein
MRKFADFGIFSLAVIFFITVFRPVCMAADLAESGVQVKALAAEGETTQARVTVKKANGGPKVNTLQVDYPGSTILSTTASLSVKKGFYKIELLENGRTSLILKAQGRKTVQGSGRLSVNAAGLVQFRVLAKNAKDVVLQLSFSSTGVVKPEKSTETVSSASASAGSKDSVSMTLTCLAGKNCRLQVRNMSTDKAYRNISFQIDYQMMELEGSVQKSKRGIIEDVLSPNKAGEWPLGLVFGEPPRDIRIKLLTFEAIDPSTAAASGPDRPKNNVLPLINSEKPQKSETTAAPMPAELPGQLIPTAAQIILMRFFESGHGSLDYNKRMYATEFPAADVHFINWELNLHHPDFGKILEYDIEAAWRNADCSLIAKRTNHVFLEPHLEMNSLTDAWGSMFAGKFWKPGAYSVDLYITGKKIASAGFKIY